MFKQLLKEVATRVATDARDITQRFVSPELGMRVATGAARALTRNWTSAVLLAEAAAARWSASSPAPTADGAPLRVLFAARFGALTPIAEAMALEALDALEASQQQDRARPIVITLCGTSALAPAGAPPSPRARRVLRHRVLDATVVSAADVAAWVGDADVVVTCNDFGATTTASADIELGAMALGLARARGLPAVALGVASPLDGFPAPARDFLRRFARKATFGAVGAAAAASLAADGFRTAVVRSDTHGADGSGDVAGVVIAIGAPHHDGGATVVSPLAEAMRLGALLLGGPETPRPPEPVNVAADVAAALRAAGVGVSIVRVGAAIGGTDGVAGDLVLDDSAAWRAWLDALPRQTRILTDAPDIAASAEAAGFGVLRLSAVAQPGDAALRRLREAVPPPADPEAISVAACLGTLLDAVAPGPIHPALPAPSAESGR